MRIRCHADHYRQGVLVTRTMTTLKPGLAKRSVRILPRRRWRLQIGLAHPRSSYSTSADGNRSRRTRFRQVPQDQPRTPRRQQQQQGTDQTEFQGPYGATSGDGIGSYAEKMRAAAQTGRGSEPSQVNQLHPLSGATDIGQYDFYAESWNQEMNESSSDFSQEAKKSEAKVVSAKSPQFWEEDETIEETVEDGRPSSSDPWGMNKELKNSIKAQRALDRSSDNIQDLPASQASSDISISRSPQKDLASIQPKVPQSRLLDGLKKDAVSSDLQAGRDVPKSGTSLPPASLDPDFSESELGQGFEKQSDPLLSAWENDMGWDESKARAEMEDEDYGSGEEDNEDERAQISVKTDGATKGWFSPDSEVQQRAMSHQSASTSQPSNPFLSSKEASPSERAAGQQSKPTFKAPVARPASSGPNKRTTEGGPEQGSFGQQNDNFRIPPDLLSSPGSISRSLNPQQASRQRRPLGSGGGRSGSRGRPQQQSNQSEQNKDAESFEDASLVQRLMNRRQAKNVPVNNEGRNFYKAADALAARLLVAVEGEKKGAEAALFRQYRRKRVPQLRSAGVILTDLVGQHYDSQHYGEYIWVFRLAKDAECKGAVFEESTAAYAPSKVSADRTTISTAHAPTTEVSASQEVLTGISKADSPSVPVATQSQEPFPASNAQDLATGSSASGQYLSPQSEASQQATTSIQTPVDQIPPETHSTAEVLTQNTTGGSASAATEPRPTVETDTSIALQDSRESAAEDRVEDSRHLPIHQFTKGDPILLLSTWLDGEIPELEEDYQSLRAQIVYVGKTFIRVTCRRDVHEQLLLDGPGKRWRMDKSVQEATAERQMQAIAMLDKPYAFLEEQENLQLRKFAINPNADEAQQQLDIVQLEEDSRKEEQAIMRETGLISKQFRVGELRVRQILLGDPRSPETAKAAPTWASVDAWKTEAKKWLQTVALGREDTRLNKSQIHAIAKSLSSTLTLWQGPPGTGKTRTLLALIEILSRLSYVKTQGGATTGPVLACADTNAATDNIVQGLVERNVNVVRIGQQSAVRDELKNVTLSAKAQEHRFGKLALERKKQADEAFKESRRGGGVDRRKDPDGFDRKRRGFLIQGQRLEKESWALMAAAQQEVLKNIEVVAGTCSGAGDYKVLQNMRFRVVVIDEATQSTEPSTLIPLLRGAESVVMAGDPKQLPPTVISDVAMKCNMDTTLFERLMATGVEPWLLDTQYRMHPQIANFPNDLFYDGELKSGVKAADRPAPSAFPWPNAACPVALVECDYGREQRAGVLKGGKLRISQDFGPGSSSYCNLEEARMAIRAFEMLMASDNVESGAIISPYKGQVRLIRSLLREQNKKVIVSSVDGYQGREADVIVFSCVRNNDLGKLGFVTDERRLNVAITRPRQGLVVVGAPDTLSGDKRWRQWMVWVRDRGGLLAPEALRPSQEELDQGCFDPQLDEYFELAPKAVPQNEWVTDADPGQWSSGLGSSWGDTFDPDAQDEQILAAWEREDW